MATDRSSDWHPLRSLVDYMQAITPDPSAEVVLRSHLFVEQKLADLIRQRLQRPDVADLDRLSAVQMAKLAASLGVFPENMIAAVGYLSKLRNKVAHKPGFKIAKTDIDKFAKYYERTDFPTVDDEDDKDLKFYTMLRLIPILNALDMINIRREARKTLQIRKKERGSN